MLSFSLVAEALTGLIYHRPSGENSKFTRAPLSLSVYSWVWCRCEIKCPLSIDEWAYPEYLLTYLLTYIYLVRQAKWMGSCTADVGLPCGIYDLAQTPSGEIINDTNKFYDFNSLMFKFLRLLIDLGQDEFQLEFTPLWTLHHDLNSIFLWKLLSLTSSDFHSSPLIFICPNPILNQLYLISALQGTFTETQQVNSLN